MAEMTLADRVRELCAAHNAEWTRTPKANGTVVVQMTFADGTVLGGTGATTAEAQAHLETRLTRFLAAQEL